MNSNLNRVFSQRVESQNTQITDNAPPSSYQATNAQSDIDEPQPTHDPLTASANDDNYIGLQWDRVPYLQKPQYSVNSKRESWVYQYGWRVWHAKELQLYWLCKYCHIHKIPGGMYVVQQSTSSVVRHLAERKPGHEVNKNGKIQFKTSEPSVITYLQRSGVEVGQRLANSVASSFSTTHFQQTLVDWVAANNQPLSVIEQPEFRELIRTANPLAERAL